MPKSKPKSAAHPKKRPSAPVNKRGAKASPKSKPAPKKVSRLAAKPKASAKAKPSPKAKPVMKAKTAAKVAAKPALKPVTKPGPTLKILPRGKTPATVTSILLNPQAKNDDAKLNPFLRKQKERLLALRDAMLDSMQGMAQDNLRSRAEGSEASAFGMHQGDAGSDAYDRDFALSLLSQEQDALYEIEEALKRVSNGTYGKCEMSGKPIAHPRLEAIPFTRFTVECQTQIERQNRNQRVRPVVTSLFGLTDEEGGDTEEEEKPEDNRDRERE
jgi:DnaK suppressor protein